MTGKKKQGKGIGIIVKAPGKECNDRHCVFHGSLKIRGRQFTGFVRKAAAQKTAVVSWERLFKLPKYERYEKRRTIIRVHNPECINAKAGDRVSVVECRPISKTKHFVIIEVK